MFKKRLKGLLAMVLAGSIALSALPLTASATISGEIDVVDGGTVYPNDITCTSGGYSFEGSSYDAISGDLGSNYLWAINADKGGTESGYIITTAKGDELAEKLYGLKESSTEYENVKIKNSHKVLVTTADPSVTDTDVSGAANVSEFPYDINLSSVDFTPTNDPLQEATWTVWYGAEFGNTVDRYSVEKGASYAISAGSTEIEIPMSTVENIYKPVSGGSTIPFGHGVTIIQLQNSYKTFEIPVYDGMGNPTGELVKVTNTSDGALIPEEAEAALKGKYVLLYDGEAYKDKHYDNDGYIIYDDITTKSGLWNAIKAAADEKREFDPAKAQLVRYVGYNVITSSPGWLYFSSIDLANNATKDGITYLEARKNDASIWEIYSNGTYKVVSGSSFDAELKKSLDTNDYSNVQLKNENTIYLTATDPSTKTDKKLADSEYKTFDSTDKYPVKVSDLAANLMSDNDKNPDPGKKYDVENWELWPCSISSGFNIGNKTDVNTKDKITVEHYEGLNGNDILIYFPQTDIKLAATVIEPDVGAVPAGVSAVTVTGDGSASAVKWSVNGTALTDGETFTYEKPYTVEITLTPSDDLELTADTPVTINGKDPASKKLSDDGTALIVSYTFEAIQRTAIHAVEFSLDQPKLGDAPDTTAAFDANAGYTVSDVKWEPADEKFKEDTAYTVSATVKANDGFKFTEDTTAKINGADATIKAGENGSYIVSYTFPKTAKAGLTGIKVTAPTKTKYKVGESIDVTGGKVTLIYEGSKTEEISLTEDMLTYDNSKAGKATVTVKYDKFEDTFEVEFEKVTVDPTEPTDNQPQIKGDNGKTGWDAISDAIADADDGDTVIIDMNGTTVLPEGILNDIAGRDIDIVLDIGGGFTWTINGTTVTNPTTIDMGVNTDSSIPVKVINALTGECSYITISLAHNGEFGFTAVLTVELGEKNKGLFANLYYYNDSTEKTEFVLSDIIDADGKADLTFTHASEYVIVIDDHDHGKASDDSSTTSDTTSDSDTNPSTGIPMISGVALVAGAAIMMISRKKKK